MQKILAISIIAILATGVIAPALQDAYALKADISNNKGAKAYGAKTQSKITHDESQKTQKSGFESLKKEQAKTFKKSASADTAQQIFKNLYRIG